MKKTISFLLASVLLSGTVLLSSCGGDDSSDESAKEAVMSEYAATDSSKESDDVSSENSSEDISDDASDDTSEESSEDGSEDDDSFDIGQFIKVPDEYKEYNIGRFLSQFESKNSFGLKFSFSQQEEDLDFFVEASCYFKNGDLLLNNSYSFGDGLYSTSSMYKDGVFYSIYHSDKTFRVENDAKDAELDFFDWNAAIIFKGTSDEIIGGVTYLVETFSSSSEFEDYEYIEKYYFLDGDLKFVSADDEVMVSVEVVDDVSDDVFQIPDDYEEIVPLTTEDILKLPEGCEDLAVAKALSKYTVEKGYTIYMLVNYSADEFGGDPYSIADTYYVKGDNIRIDFEQKEFDENGNPFSVFRNIYMLRDGVSYDVYPDDKTYYIVEENAEFEDISWFTFFGDLSYKETTTEEIDGVLYTVDIFVFDYDYDYDDFFVPEEDSSLEYYDQVKFYTLDDELVYMDQYGDFYTVRITSDDDIIKSAFEIIDRYTLVEYTFDI